MARKDNRFAAAPVDDTVTADPEVFGVNDVMEPVAGVPLAAAPVDDTVMAIVQTQDHVAEQPSENVISNPGNNVRRIGGIVIAPGGVYTLTEKDLADEKSMAKIEHMIKLGVLHRGAD